MHDNTQRDGFLLVLKMPKFWEKRMWKFSLSLQQRSVGGSLNGVCQKV